MCTGLFIYPGPPHDFRLHGYLEVTVAEFIISDRTLIIIIKLVLSGFMDKLLSANGGCLGIGRR